MLDFVSNYKIYFEERLPLTRKINSRLSFEYGANLEERSVLEVFEHRDSFFDSWMLVNNDLGDTGGP